MTTITVRSEPRPQWHTCPSRDTVLDTLAFLSNIHTAPTLSNIAAALRVTKDVALGLLMALQAEGRVVCVAGEGEHEWVKRGVCDAL